MVILCVWRYLHTLIVSGSSCRNGLVAVFSPRVSNSNKEIRQALGARLWRLKSAGRNLKDSFSSRRPGPLRGHSGYF
ncbi:hypothetical protein GGP65_001016 [Salinibacter ruber]|uniref:Uncharacterized protein n=1 Tax=Salinibacter ruber TaxID=146919 RepID=A0A9X2REM0_9BACT|nr:hypothetical protein [Salinibacter ruber]MCS3752705.1 hypothetical protein [Salinibacter ruber]MCS3857873.1 hypothetical protein [Salinibacter ruber]MCS3864700.1 hypothetical protein [Salinibacter ruber]MCS4039972.1 hypothetical protein [Salinibacter ruber]